MASNAAEKRALCSGANETGSSTRQAERALTYMPTAFADQKSTVRPWSAAESQSQAQAQSSRRKSYFHVERRIVLIERGEEVRRSQDIGRNGTAEGLRGGGRHGKRLNLFGLKEREREQTYGGRASRREPERGNATVPAREHQTSRGSFLECLAVAQRT